MAYAVALGHAMRRQPARALEAIGLVDMKLQGRIPAWILQAWSFWKADILFISGKRTEAFRTAQAGFGADNVLHNRSFAGALPAG